MSIRIGLAQEQKLSAGISAQGTLTASMGIGVGPQGPQGIQGERGPIGPQGPKGEDGASIQQEEIDKINNNIDYLHSLQYAPFAGTNVKSDFTLAGTVKDMSIKGRTLQNLVDRYNYSLNIYATTCFINENLIRENTLYSAIVRNNTAEALQLYWNENTFKVDTRINIPPNGVAIFKNTTLDTLPGIGVPTRAGLFKNNIAYTQLNYTVVLLEGDYTNTPLSELPYIEGIQSVGEQEDNVVEVKSCGKNLFDGEMIKGTISGSDGDIVTGFATRVYTPNYIKIYTGSVCCKNYNGKWVGIFGYDKNKKYLSYKSSTSGEVSLTFSNMAYVRISTEDIQNYKTSIQLEEGTTETPYEPYQEDTAQITLEEPLRSLPNGVCDEVSNGKLIRRVGKVVLDGSEKNISLYQSRENVIVFKTDSIGCLPVRDTNLICDNFIANDVIAYIESEGVASYTSGGIYLGILKSKLKTQDATGFKQWLQENPTTVYYELAEPVITELGQSINLDTYIGTTHITSTNILQPTLEGKVRTDIAAALVASREENQALKDRMGCLECDIANVYNTMNRLMAQTLIPE